MRKLVFIFAFVIAFSGIANCQSVIINFDDVSGIQFGDMAPQPISNGYQNFNWINLYIANATSFPQSGILNGMVSGPNIAASPGSPINSPITSSISSSTPFILASGYFTSAFLNSMSLEITGLNGATKVFDQTFTLNVTGPSFLTFPSSPITEVDFTPSGGSLPGPGYLGGGSEMVLDNLTVEPLPEPSTCLLLSLGIGSLVILCRKHFIS